MRPYGEYPRLTLYKEGIKGESYEKKNGCGRMWWFSYPPGSSSSILNYPRLNGLNRYLELASPFFSTLEIFISFRHFSLLDVMKKYFVI